MLIQRLRFKTLVRKRKACPNRLYRVHPFSGQTQRYGDMYFASIISGFLSLTSQSSREKQNSLFFRLWWERWERKL